MKAVLMLIFTFLWSSFLFSTPTDTTVAYQRILLLKKEWKETKGNDSAFVFQHSDDPDMLKLYHEGTYPEGTANSFSKSKKNEVIGPFPLSNGYAIYKNAGAVRTCDSVQVAHILIAYTGARGSNAALVRTKEQAKKKADSLCALIKNGKVLFDNVVESVTDDPGSLTGNKGNYGWFTRESGFIQEYKDAAFANPVGAVVVIESMFGYHIIHVIAKTKEFNCINAWRVSVAIDTCYTSSGKLREYGVTYPGGDEYFAHDLDSIIHNNTLLTDFHHEGMIWITLNIMEDGTTTDVNVWGSQEMSDGVRASIADVYSRLRFVPAHSCEGTTVSSMNFLYPR